MKYITAAFAVAGMSACLVAQQAQQYPSQADFDWVDSRFHAVLEQLLLVAARLGDSLGYRSVRELHTEELEYAFLFNRERSKPITATVVIPDTVSLYDQIMALHRKNPRTIIDAMVPLLKIKRWQMSETTCPAVRKEYDRFYELALVMRSSKDREEEATGQVTIRLHPRAHLFKADISGGRIDLVLTDPEHPYVKWAEETQRALEGCTAAQRVN